MICRSKFNKNLCYLYNIDKDNVHMKQGDFKITITKEMFDKLFEIIDSNEQ